MAIIVNILLIIFIPVCILLILMVLLQAGKGGGLSGAFGGMGANQPFLGSRGTASFLSKFTVYLAIGFMTLSLILSIFLGTSRSIRVKEEVPAAVETQGTETGGTATQKPITIPAGKTTKPQTLPSSTGTPKTPAPSPSGK
jgi:preprotein translocase subunit SecG